MFILKWFHGHVDFCAILYTYSPFSWHSQKLFINAFEMENFKHQLNSHETSKIKCQMDRKLIDEIKMKENIFCDA